MLTAAAYVCHALRERERDECGQPFVLDVSTFRQYLGLDRLIDVHLRALSRRRVCAVADRGTHTATL